VKSFLSQQSITIIPSPA